MVIIKAIKDQLKPLLKHKQDRSVIMSALSTPFSLLMSLIKVIIGILYVSPFLLFFGAYYIVLSLAKLGLLYRYTIIRTSREMAADKENDEHAEIIFGGCLLILTSVIFSLASLYMYYFGFNYHLSANMTYIIALMGFTKLISSIVGLIRARRFHINIINLIKIFNLTNGITSIILTQYTILALEKSEYVNISTGLFGLVSGVILTIVGITFIYLNRKSN